MFAMDVNAETPTELRRRYASELEAIVDEAGDDRVREETDLDPSTIDAIRAGAADVALADAAAVLAIDDDRSADDIVTEVRDVLLMDMSTAVLDVEAIAAEVDGLDPGEIQAKIEGRYPMTVAEYARIRHRVERA